MSIESIESVAQWLIKKTSDPDFVRRLGGILYDVCAIPTVPGNDVEQNAEQENTVFNLLEKAIREAGLPGLVERRPIAERISEHSRYTLPYYTTSASPYKGRSNLLHVYRPDSTKITPSFGVAFNAHIDTVAPHIPPREVGTTLFGRGSSDDKGCCVAIVGALSLLESLRIEKSITPKGNVVSMFVIEEETGGNGSLSLVLDDEVSALYETVVVAESTEDQIHPANRGAVWYKVELGAETPENTLLALKIVKALEKAGQELRSERSHPLFPAKPVQTCHGILGAFGEHPSGICGEIEFKIIKKDLRISGSDEKLYHQIEKSLEKGLQKYLAEYGQRMPEGAHHYKLCSDDDGYRVTFLGTTGHMGSSYENDNAITTAAFLIPEVMQDIPGLEVILAKPCNGSFALEGGQGFMPCHAIEEIKEKMSAAVNAALENEFITAYKEHARTANSTTGEIPKITFDKLHNDAFACDPDSPQVRMALEAARLVGMPVDLPLRGFKASCDARLFAHLRPEKTVITAGPGTIRVAHSDDESIDLKELARSAAFYALYALYATGALQ